MARLGIARVTDITRLDRLGVPVYASIRPRGAVLRVHAGKGLRPIDARVGALMEAIELAVAEPERSRAPRRVMRAAEVVAQFDDGLRWIDLIPVLGLQVGAGRRIDVVQCERLGTTDALWLPSELVFAPFDTAPRASIFGWSTNGLASGNSLVEATLHALFEVLERDALAMNKARDTSAWVDPASLPKHWRVRADAWRASGIELAVRFVPSDTGLSCFEACLHEPGSDSVNLAAGAGLHPDRGIALNRAICEAAQSRLSHVHGGREDVVDFYRKYAGRRDRRVAREAAFVAATFDRSHTVSFRQLPHLAVRDVPLERLLDDMLERLSRAGFRHVFRHRFRRPLGGLHVVRVVVPRCEHAERDTGRIGPRLLARVIGRASGPQAAADERQPRRDDRPRQPARPPSPG